ncbi:class I ribonucleotide reductase maintenance protein YfaE [Pseudoalteromonas fenneropenaei]|uniref:Class I ribonucleotide reductase maintenance protein YfaE n=1 Tax=Pseudoalteromonas fenneropenaei TaxID=1737459 RepID=A0ABV7CPF4_9GAMM
MVEKPLAKIHLVNLTEPLTFAAQCPSLLDALEQAKVDVNYQCREGFCGACRVKLVAGQVAYNVEPLAFVREGEVLSCCCKPLSDITIELP